MRRLISFGASLSRRSWRAHVVRAAGDFGVSVMGSKNQSQLARTLAPEEIKAGQFIAVLSRTYESIPRSAEGDALASSALRRWEFMSMECEPPLRVVAVCVPWVLCERPDKRPRMIDIRRSRVAALSGRFGWVAFQRLKSAKLAPSCDCD